MNIMEQQAPFQYTPTRGPLRDKSKPIVTHPDAIEANRNHDLADLPGEEWRDIVGFDGYYQASSLGRIKSLQRIDRRGRIVKERIMRIAFAPSRGRMSLRLSVDGVITTHEPSRLVAIAFFGGVDDDKLVIHRNKELCDNRLVNLLVGDWSESSTLDYKMGANADWGVGQIKRKHRADMDAQLEADASGQKCRRCNRKQPWTEFQLKKQGPWTSYERICYTCRNSDFTQPGVIRRAKELFDRGFRKCCVCKDVKPLVAFGANRSQYRGVSNNCRECARRLGREYKSKQSTATPQ